MKSLFLMVFTVALFAAFSLAQTSAEPQSSQPAAQSPSAQSANAVPPGTIIPAELAKSIDAKKAKSGSEVVAKTTQDLTANGQVIIPRGSKIIGHVTEAQARSKEQAQSTLGIAFDRIEKKGGGQMSLAAAIQAMAPPQRNPSPAGNEPMSENPGMAGPGSNPGNMGGGGMGRPAGAPGATPPEYPQGTTTPSGGAPSSGGVAALPANSHGVLGIEGLTLSSGEGNANHGTVITSSNRNVHLDSGTQLILRATASPVTH